MPTVYVDWDTAGDSGTGTTGDPYSSITYALSQESTTTGDLIIKVRGNSYTSFNENGTGRLDLAKQAADSLLVEPDTGFDWGTSGPQLTIFETNAFTDCVRFTGSNCTLRGFNVEQRSTSDGNAIRAADGTSDNVIDSCKIYADLYGVQSSGAGGRNLTIKNCLIANYNNGDTYTGIRVDGYTYTYVYNCVIVGNGSGGNGYEQDADANTGIIRNTIFLNWPTNAEVVLNGSSVTQSNNACDKGTAPTNLSGAVLNVVTGNFEDGVFTDPRTAGSDFRLVSGNTNLDNEGVAVAGVTADAFGTTYLDPPSIGYHQLTASGTTIPTVIESHPQRIIRKKGWYV